MQTLENKKIAILVTNGFEHSELTRPMAAISKAGGTPEIVSLESGEIKSWKDQDWGDSFRVDKTVDSVSADDYDGALLPGGVINPDLLRKNAKAVEFVKGFFQKDKQKPVAAICHGPWMLAEADVIRDRKLTSYESIKTDLKNAGANWVDEEVVVDNGLVTSRSPEDLEAFIDKMIEEYNEGKHTKH